MNPANAVNFYSFSGTAGQVVSMSSQSFARNQAEFYLFGPNGQNIGPFYGFGFANQDQRVTLPQTGDYTLVVSGTDEAPGDTNAYSFVLSTPTVAPTPITFGTVVSGEVTAPAQRDSYTFSGTAGQTIYYDALNYPNFPDLNIEIITPSGQYLPQNYYFESSQSFDISPFVLPETGTYTLEVFFPSQSSGDDTYSFQLLDEAQATPIPLVNQNDQTYQSSGGYPVTGTLDPGSETVLYSITSTAAPRTRCTLPTAASRRAGSTTTARTNRSRISPRRRTGWHTCPRRAPTRWSYRETSMTRVSIRATAIPTDTHSPSPISCPRRRRL